MCIYVYYMIYPLAKYDDNHFSVLSTTCPVCKHAIHVIHIIHIIHIIHVVHIKTHV